MNYKLAFKCNSCKTKIQFQVSNEMFETKKMVRCSNCQELNTIKIPVEKVFLERKKKRAQHNISDDKTVINDARNSSSEIRFEVQEGAFTKAQYFVISNDRTLIGRKNNGGPNVKPDIEIVSKDGFMSKIHCEIKKVGNDFSISDNNSANGTWLNGEKLTKEDHLFLKVGDILRLGRTEIVISIK
tara:strand:+ start:415 stop:969 length:555 start_codon:yes stop_codon:yes gene_type:complete